MESSFWIGIVAAVLTTSAFVPQVMKAHFTKQTKDLSMTMFVLLVAGLVLWIIYGVISRSIPLLFANGITLLMATYLIFLKLKHG